MKKETRDRILLEILLGICLLTLFLFPNARFAESRIIDKQMKRIPGVPHPLSTDTVAIFLMEDGCEVLVTNETYALYQIGELFTYRRPVCMFCIYGSEP